jgi:hypothetical protein
MVLQSLWTQFCGSHPTREEISCNRRECCYKIFLLVIRYHSSCFVGSHRRFLCLCSSNEGGHLDPALVPALPRSHGGAEEVHVDNIPEH